jgi:hypothetical protein
MPLRRAPVSGAATSEKSNSSENARSIRQSFQFRKRLRKPGPQAVRSLQRPGRACARRAPVSGVAMSEVQAHGYSPTCSNMRDLLRPGAAALRGSVKMRLPSNEFELGRDFNSCFPASLRF